MEVICQIIPQSNLILKFVVLFEMTISSISIFFSISHITCCTFVPIYYDWAPGTASQVALG